MVTTLFSLMSTSKHALKALSSQLMFILKCYAIIILLRKMLAHINTSPHKIKRPQKSIIVTTYKEFYTNHSHMWLIVSSNGKFFVIE